MFFVYFLFHSITLSTMTTASSAGSSSGSGNGGGNNGDTNVENSNVTAEMSAANDSLALVPFTPMECLDMAAVDEFSKEQPDPDTIKMFVGQVPKAWDEMKLRSLFEQYGRVHTLNVLRDKVTMMSRGK